MHLRLMFVEVKLSTLAPDDPDSQGEKMSTNRVLFPIRSQTTATSRWHPTDRRDTGKSELSAHNWRPNQHAPAHTLIGLL